MAENEYVYTQVAATADEEMQMRQSAVNVTSSLFGPMSGSNPREKIHAYALGHGLPEIPGWYGYDFERHEFIRMPFEQLEGQR